MCHIIFTYHYDWIKFDQIKWYRDLSQGYTKINNNSPLNALAFFHIPLPEYKIVQQMESTIGVRVESVSSPAINSGMYSAMLEMGDIMGVFVEHDHNNNFIGCLNKIDFWLKISCENAQVQPSVTFPFMEFMHKTIIYLHRL